MSTHIGPYRVVDLTRPATGRIKLEQERYFDERTGDYHTTLTLDSHEGTHVEAPHHFKGEWPGIAEMPPTAFMGRAVVLHLPMKAEDEQHWTGLLEGANRIRVRPGDIVLLRSFADCVEPFSTDAPDDRPQLNAEAAEWFVEKQVKAIGFGATVAIEKDDEASREFHEIVMAPPHNIMLLEALPGLWELEDDIVFLMYQPLPVDGLDSSPVSVYAIEGIPGFCTPGKEAI